MTSQSSSPQPKFGGNKQGRLKDEKSELAGCEWKTAAIRVVVQDRTAWENARVSAKQEEDAFCLQVLSLETCTAMVDTDGQAMARLSWQEATVTSSLCYRFNF